MKGNVTAKKLFLEYFKKTPIQKYAAAHAGVHEDTVKNWKDSDSDFSDRLQRAKAAFVSQKLGKVRSNEWILERIFKSDFSPRQELTGKDGDEIKGLVIVKDHKKK